MPSYFLQGPVPVELEALLAIVGGHLSGDSQAADRADRALAELEDWPALLALARRHRVLPLLHQGLSGRGRDRVPPDVRRLLQREFAANLKKNLRLAHHAVESLRALSESGIRVIPFKGVFLAHSAYGNLSHRQVNDIDLLVAPGDRVMASNILESLGYCPVETLDQQAVFRNFTTQIEIDLHWHLTPAFFPVRQAFEDAFEHSRVRVLAESPYHDLSARDQLLWLSIQVGKDCWERQQKLVDLQKVCDLFQVNRQLETGELEELMDEADRLGLGGVLDFSFHLLQGLLELNLPAGVERRLRSDDRARRLAVGAASLPELAQAERPPERNPLWDVGLRWRQLRFFMGLRESWDDRRAYLSGIVRSLGGADTRRGRVPERERRAIWSGQLLTAIALQPSASALTLWAIWRKNFDLDAVDRDEFRVLPRVHRTLAARGHTGPEQRRLAGVYKQMRLRNAVWRERLPALLRLFDDADCPVLIGSPACVALARPDSPEPLDPLSLIVPLDEVERADGRLRDDGWRSERPLPPEDVRAFVASMAYTCPERGELVLCWRPLGIGSSPDRETALWADREAVPGVSFEVGMPCAVDQALIVALRGGRIPSFVINAELGVSWGEIAERARDFGLEPAALRLGRGNGAEEDLPLRALLSRHRARYATVPPERRPASFIHYLRDYHAWAWQTGLAGGLSGALTRRLRNRAAR